MDIFKTSQRTNNLIVKHATTKTETKKAAFSRSMILISTEMLELQKQF